MNEFTPVTLEMFKEWGIGNRSFLNIDDTFCPKSKRKKGMSDEKFSDLVNKEKSRWNSAQEKKIADAINQGYKYYCKSGNAPFKILGKGDTLRKDSFLKNNFGVIEEGGVLLLMKKWSVYYNDAAILGAIHAAQTVYLNCKFSSIPNKDLYDFDKGRPTLLGREIIMLSAAGYQLIKRDSDDLLGSVIILSKNVDASQLTLPLLRERVEAVKDFSQIPFLEL